MLPNNLHRSVSVIEVIHVIDAFDVLNALG